MQWSDQTTEAQSSPLLNGFLVALLYGIFSILWIGLSDNLLAVWIADSELLSLAQTLKGILFVVASAAVLMMLVVRTQRARQADRSAFHAAALLLRGLEQQELLGIIALDGELRPIFWNTRAAACTGLESEHALQLGLSAWTRLFPDSEERDLLMQQLRSCLQLQRPTPVGTALCRGAHTDSSDTLKWHLQPLHTPLEEDCQAPVLLIIGIPDRHQMPERKTPEPCGSGDVQADD